jgi:hypothetical protein
MAGCAGSPRSGRRPRRGGRIPVQVCESDHRPMSYRGCALPGVNRFCLGWVWGCFWVRGVGKHCRPPVGCGQICFANRLRRPLRGLIRWVFCALRLLTPIEKELENQSQQLNQCATRKKKTKPTHGKVDLPSPHPRKTSRNREWEKKSFVFNDLLGGGATSAMSHPYDIAMS